MKSFGHSFVFNQISIRLLLGRPGGKRQLITQMRLPAQGVSQLCGPHTGLSIFTNLIFLLWGAKSANQLRA